MWIAYLVLSLLVAYGAVGVASALMFVTIGVGRVDPSAKGAPLGFRLLILPGAAALWPLVMTLWWRRR